MGRWVDLVLPKEKEMDYNITELILVIMFLAWQVMMWKKIKLPKWIDYTMSGIAISLTAWLVYSAFLS